MTEDDYGSRGTAVPALLHDDEGNILDWGIQTLIIISCSWLSAGLLNKLLMMQLMLPLHIPQTSLRSYVWSRTSGMAWKSLRYPLHLAQVHVCIFHPLTIHRRKRFFGLFKKTQGEKRKVGCTDAEKRSTHISSSAKSSYIITTICSSGIPFLWTIWYAWQASAWKTEKSTKSCQRCLLTGWKNVFLWHLSSPGACSCTSHWSRLRSPPSVSHRLTPGREKTWPPPRDSARAGATRLVYTCWAG